MVVTDRLYWNSNRFWLACAEGDDAPDRIVRRHADGHAISRNDLDAEAAHAAAELGEHFVAGVALHAVKTATVNRHHGALHVDEIVLAQTASSPFIKQTLCHIGRSQTAVRRSARSTANPRVGRPGAGQPVPDSRPKHASSTCFASAS